jgi:hypothetical protein
VNFKIHHKANWDFGFLSSGSTFYNDEIHVVLCEQFNYDCQDKDILLICDFVALAAIKLSYCKYN